MYRYTQNRDLLGNRIGAEHGSTSIRITYRLKTGSASSQFCNFTQFIDTLSPDLLAQSKCLIICINVKYYIIWNCI